MYESPIIFEIGPQIPEKNPLKYKNDGGGDHCCCLGAHLIAHSSKTGNDRNQWIVLLSRAKNVVYEPSMTFKNQSTDTREKSFQT